MLMERFQAEHLLQIDMQPVQLRTWQRYGSQEYARELAEGMAYTGRLFGRIIVCGGIIDTGPDSGHLWSFISRDACRHFIRLHRTARRFLDVSGKRHLSATTEVTFDDGCRWLEMLGFSRSTFLAGYGPDGANHYLYERVH